jgi:hypothetical protein
MENSFLNSVPSAKVYILNTSAKLPPDPPGHIISGTIIQYAHLKTTATTVLGKQCGSMQEHTGYGYF